MSANNEMLLRRWFEEVWNKGRVEAIDEMMAADAIAHGLGDTPAVGTTAFKAFHAKLRSAFPDIRITVDEVVSQGDRAAVRFTCWGTHRGDQLGISATGREVSFPAMSFVRIQNGQIAEGWNSVDMLGMLQQVGGVDVKAKLS